MTQIIVQPRELRHFSAFLVELSRDLRHTESRCTAELRSLRSVWRDEKLEEFEPKYARATDEISRFCMVCERYAAYLDAKATRAERYLAG